MSSALYPLSMIDRYRLTPMTRVIGDQSESGTERTRRIWPDKYVKHLIDFNHAALTVQEFEELASFVTARNGTYDDFWFRDNITRKGNMKCRFVDDLQYSRVGNMYEVRVKLRETTARKALPGGADVQDALTNGADYFWDANAQKLHTHLNEETYEQNLYNLIANEVDGTQLAGVSTGIIADTKALQYQYFGGNGHRWNSQDIIPGGIGNAPVSFFCFCKAGTSASDQVVLATGEKSGTKLRALRLNSSNEWCPWLGSTDTYTNAKSTNSPNDTWRSVAVVYEDVTTHLDCHLIVNGVLIGTDAQVPDTWSGNKPVSMAAEPAGANTFGGNMGHCITSMSPFSVADVKAMHNLFAYQYGVAEVA